MVVQGKVELLSLSGRLKLYARPGNIVCHPCFAVLLVGLALAAWLAPYGFPCPRDDDGWYKNPAAELFQNGRLAMPSAQGFLPRADVAFATQPPLYQLMLSGWYRLFGFSLQTTLSFSFTVHLLSALAVSLVTKRLLSDLGELPKRLVYATVLSVGLIHLANLAYFDRPEETALLWLWLDVLLLSGVWARLTISAALATGLLIGLAGLTALWVGILGLLFVFFRCALVVWGQPKQQWRRATTKAVYCLCASTAVAGLMIFTWYAVWEAAQPGIFADQFFGALQHLRQNQHLDSLAQRFRALRTTILFNPTQLAATVITIRFFPPLMIARGRQQTTGSALYLAGVIGVIAVLVFRPRAYTYLGATQMLLLPCFGPAVAVIMHSSQSTARRRLGTTVLIGCVLLAISHVVDLGRWTWQLPHDQRQQPAYARLAELIPPGEPVAVTARHWYVFQGRNPWRDAFFSALTSDEEVRHCRWLVLDPSVGIPPFIEHFERVEVVPTKVRADRTYAYSVWRRKE